MNNARQFTIRVRIQPNKLSRAVPLGNCLNLAAFRPKARDNNRQSRGDGYAARLFRYFVFVSAGWAGRAGRIRRASHLHGQRKSATRIAGL